MELRINRVRINLSVNEYDYKLDIILYYFSNRYLITHCNNCSKTLNVMFFKINFN